MAKDADITIYKPSGEARMAAHIGKGSKREFTLMEKDCVTLKFTAAEATQLHLGDYIEIAGAGRYELTEPYTPEKSKTTGGYDYEITLEAQHRKFKNKLLKFLPFVGTGETSWSYTDSMGAFAKILLDNLRALAYERESDGTEALTSGREGYLWNGKKDWAITWDESVDDTKAFTLTFSDTSILDAIDMIAEELECEWWWEKETLHFGKCEYGGDDPTALSYGTEICGISKKQSKEDYATRLYCYGSDRNLPSTYRKELVFTADTLNDAKDETRDSARELSASFFPKAMRAVGAKDQQTLNLMHTHGGTVSNTAATVENIALTSDTATISGLNSGFWTIGLSAFRPKVTIDAHTGNSDEAVVEVKLTAVYASGATESWTWSATQYLYALGVAIEVTGFQDQSIQLAEETAKLTATATYYLRMGSNSSVGMSVQTMDAGKITASNKYPTYGATGVTIEIVDTLTGETTETITGATYNPDFLASSPTLKLPSGKTWSKGTKFKLPDLNAALVPASYFTSKYAVLDKYTDLTTNGIVNSRLLLPEEDEAGEPLPGYIDVTELESEEEAVERVVTFDEIYPRRTSTVQEVLTEEKTDTQEEQDGSTTYVKWISYRIKDDLFNEENPFDNTYLLDGQDLEITFQSGLLNGLTFGAAYLSDDTFEIQRDDTTLLPNELIKPQAGDTYIISGFNIAMISDAKADYIGSAERELLEEARKYAEELNTDTNTYECTMFCDWAQKQAGADGQCLGIGQRVNLYHKAYFGEGCRESRVIGYEIPLDIPYDNPVYLIGETASYSRLGALESEVKSVGVKAGSAGRASGSTTTIGGSSSSGTGASVEIIKTGDATAETDENVYSALRALEEIKSRALSRLNADTAQGLITFMAGLISNGAVRIDSTLTTLGDITAGADAVISGLLHALGNIKGDGTLEIAGDSEIGGKLTVKDAIEALKTIAAKDDISTEGNVTANLNMTAKWAVKGKTLESEEKATVGTDLSVKNDATVKNQLTVEKEIFTRAMTVGSQYVPDTFGGRVWEDEEGNVHFECDFLLVHKKAQFKELEIDKMSHVGGCLVISPAGMECTRVVPIWNAEETIIIAYKCYCATEDGDGRKIYVEFAEGDLARCQEFNVETQADGYSGNRYYWRKVLDVGYTKPEYDSEGNLVETDYDPERGVEGWIIIGNAVGEYDTGSDAPQAGDSIVAMGNATNTSRQAVTIISSYGEGSPYIYQFTGINTFALKKDNLKTAISPSGNKFTGQFVIEGTGQDVVDYIEDNTYLDSFSMMLTSEFEGIVVDDGGEPVSGTLPRETTVTVYRGTQSQIGFTLSVECHGCKAAAVNQTVYLSEVYDDYAWVEITATKQDCPELTKTWTIAKVPEGAVGADGLHAVVFEIEPDVKRVFVDSSDNCDPEELGCKVYMTIGGEVRREISSSTANDQDSYQTDDDLVYLDGMLIVTKKTGTQVPTDLSLAYLIERAEDEVSGTDTNATYETGMESDGKKTTATGVRSVAVTATRTDDKDPAEVPYTGPIAMTADMRRIVFKLYKSGTLVDMETVEIQADATSMMKEYSYRFETNERLFESHYQMIIGSKQYLETSIQQTAEQILLQAKKYTDEGISNQASLILTAEDIQSWVYTKEEIDGMELVNQTMLNQTASSITASAERYVDGKLMGYATTTWTSDQIQSKVEDLENGAISTLTQTAKDITARVENAEGNISQLRLDVDGLSSLVGSSQEAIDAIQDLIGEKEYYEQATNPADAWEDSFYNHLGAVWLMTGASMVYVDDKTQEKLAIVKGHTYRYYDIKGTKTGWEDVTSVADSASYISQTKDKIAAVVANFDDSGNVTQASGIVTTAYGNELWSEKYVTYKGEQYTLAGYVEVRYNEIVSAVTTNTNNITAAAKAADDAAQAAADAAAAAAVKGEYYSQQANPYPEWDTPNEHIGAVWYATVTGIGLYLPDGSSAATTAEHSYRFIGTIGSKGCWEDITNTYTQASYISQKANSITAVVGNFNADGTIAEESSLAIVIGAIQSRVTDLEGNSVTVTQTATGYTITVGNESADLCSVEYLQNQISMKVSSDDLKETGIDIEQGKITVTTDQFEIQKDNGDGTKTTTASINSDGVLECNGGIFKGDILANSLKLKVASTEWNETAQATIGNIDGGAIVAAYTDLLIPLPILDTDQMVSIDLISMMRSRVEPSITFQSTDSDCKIGRNEFFLSDFDTTDVIWTGIYGKLIGYNVSGVTYWNVIDLTTGISAS